MCPGRALRTSVINGTNECTPKNARYVLVCMILIKENRRDFRSGPAKTAGARAIKHDNDSPRWGT